MYGHERYRREGVEEEEEEEEREEEEEEEMEYVLLCPSEPRRPCHIDALATMWDSLGGAPGGGGASGGGGGGGRGARGGVFGLCGE